MTNEPKTNPQCPVCNRGILEDWCSGIPLDYTTTKSFIVCRCNICGYGATVISDLEDLGVFYEEGAYNKTEALLQKLARKIQIASGKRMAQRLRALAPGVKMLEVGTGKGAFLEGARRAGFQIRGIEPSTRSRHFAEKLLGKGTVTGAPLAAHDAPEEFYDIICSWHVLEHIKDTNAALSQMARLLRKKGILCLGVPNFASRQAVKSGGNWYHLDPPRHLHHFTPESLQILIKRHGLRVESINHGSTLLDFIGETITILNRLSPSKNALLNHVKQNHLYYTATGLTGFFTFAWNIFLLPIILPVAFFRVFRDKRSKRAATFILTATRDETIQHERI